MFKNLKFKIGEQYEKWENKLEITEERIQGYDSYILKGALTLPKSIIHVELTYELDILALVVAEITNEFKEQLLTENEEVSNPHREDNLFYSKVENTLIWYVLQESKNGFIFTFGKPKVMKKLFSFLP